LRALFCGIIFSDYVLFMVRKRPKPLLWGEVDFGGGVWGGFVHLHRIGEGATSRGIRGSRVGRRDMGDLMGCLSGLGDLAADGVDCVETERVPE
jgi:hypothetical protein